MTPDQIEGALRGLKSAGAPELVCDAAKALFKAGWSLDDFGNLCLLIAARTQVFDKAEDAERALAEDAMADKPGRTN